MQRERGFTLIELLIVVAIIGVIAAIAIPNLITAMNRARQKRTMADMRSVAMAWEARATDTGNYNAAGFSLCCTVSMPTTEMRRLLAPTFIKSLRGNDAWGNPLEFAIDAAGRNYLVRSYGRDGARQPAPSGGGTSNMDDDIIFSNGSFVQYPEGAQKP
ncbi:MAG TPA: prepilin-type N-terminal cleavage/methylation domain-containing protein [Thermoanaerobaculia bacterium]|nr:prepilin-type N-terminal cleavage/methylation domain-containing protein [Thermoanaerobaculia bacterium]